MEKRKQPRFNGEFPVRLRIAGQSGQKFEIHTLADNVSQGGLYLQLPYALDAGTTLFTMIWLPGGAKLAAYGRVLREERENTALFGIAISFRHSRLLSGFAE